ncbi:MAG: Gfo/Idh/MocA family oxidoreductase, partial [Oscillospiraceae bacterium]
MNKKIDIAIVGCGGIGNFHLDNLLKYEDVNIVALASTNKQQLALTLKKAPNAKGYSSAKEMIEKEKIDCLFVCV